MSSLLDGNLTLVTVHWYGNEEEISLIVILSDLPNLSLIRLPVLEGRVKMLHFFSDIYEVFKLERSL